MRRRRFVSGDSSVITLANDDGTFAKPSPSRQYLEGVKKRKRYRKESEIRIKDILEENDNLKMLKLQFFTLTGLNNINLLRSKKFNQPTLMEDIHMSFILNIATPMMIVMGLLHCQIHQIIEQRQFIVL